MTAILKTRLQVNFTVYEYLAHICAAAVDHNAHKWSREVKGRCEEHHDYNLNPSDASIAPNLHLQRYPNGNKTVKRDAHSDKNGKVGD